MGEHLGEFGTRRERDDTFGWFGERMRVHPQATELQLFDFLRDAETVDAANVAAAMRLMHKLFGQLVHPDDFPRFWELSIANGQTTEDLIELTYQIVGAATRRPTRRRSASSAGRRGTVANLKDVSSRQVIRRLERQGRADLALHVVAARDARLAS